MLIFILDSFSKSFLLIESLIVKIFFSLFKCAAADQTRMMQDQMQMQMPPDPSKAFKVQYANKID